MDSKQPSPEMFCHATSLDKLDRVFATARALNPERRIRIVGSSRTGKIDAELAEHLAMLDLPPFPFLTGGGVEASGVAVGEGLTIYYVDEADVPREAK